MASTTNYSWSTPDDTALVKDGAAAIRTLGSSVDTTVKALNPGTTAGDIDYYTSSTAKSRVAIGTSGQVLTVNGSGVPAWATSSSGGMTLLSTTSLSGSASVTISSIDQTYNEIQIWCDGMKSTDNNINMRVNGLSSSIYSVKLWSNNNASIGALTTQLGIILQLQDPTSPGQFKMTCKNYTSTDAQKLMLSNGVALNTLGAGAIYNFTGYINIGAINSVTFYTDGGLNFTAGTIKIYGVK